MTLNPKISIITITYNAEKHIEKTIKSIIEQDYENIEYIIIDGKSTDNTLKIINKYIQYVNILISESDNGIYDAMNKGLDQATGDWINFLNAGDTFFNHSTVENIFNSLENHYKVIYGDWININDSGINNYIKSMPILSMKTLCSKFQMNHQSLFVKNYNLPFYDLEYKIKADYQWVIDIVRKLSTDEIKYINESLVYYDIEGISSKQLIANVEEYIYLTKKNFGIFQVLKNLPIYIKYYIKYILFKVELK